MEIICPIDKKDDAIQKVSAILMSGNVIGSFSGPSSGAVNVDGKSGSLIGYTYLSGATQTELARQVAPPIEPTKPSRSDLKVLLETLGYTLTIMLPLGLIACCGTAILTSNSAPAGILILLALLAEIAFVFIFINIHRRVDARENHSLLQLQSEYEIEKQKWDRAIKNWTFANFA
jgi:hypothetical protein